MILVRDRGAEERHDPVAGVLVHRPLEPVHAVGEKLKEAVQDGVPSLGIDLLGEFHRALHVGEEDRHLLALALEGGLRGENPLDEVARRVRTEVTRWGGARRTAHRLAAAVAEPGGWSQASSAADAGACERSAAPVTEPGVLAVAVTARRAAERALNLHEPLGRGGPSFPASPPGARGLSTTSSAQLGRVPSERSPSDVLNSG